MGNGRPDCQNVGPDDYDKADRSMIVLSLPECQAFGLKLAGALVAEHAVIEVRRFPDGESYLRLPPDLRDRSVILNCTLANPDSKLGPIVFAADAARELGAATVGLAAPYLAYMRQDTRFSPGEAVTSRSFAKMLSAAFDWLVTVDPHLHRHDSLDAIYTIPANVVHAAPLLGAWIGTHVERPLLIGPDSESEQWVAELANVIQASYVVLNKQRLGDRSVRIDFPDMSPFAGRWPILIDDIASSGRTMIEAAKRLHELGMARPVCAIIHPLFVGDSFASLSQLSSRIVSTDTVPHESNTISVAGLLAAEIVRILDKLEPPSQSGG